MPFDYNERWNTFYNSEAVDGITVTRDDYARHLEQWLDRKRLQNRNLRAQVLEREIRLAFERMKTARYEEAEQRRLQDGSAEHPFIID